jgi:hypothetical protein
VGETAVNVARWVFQRFFTFRFALSALAAGFCFVVLGAVTSDYGFSFMASWSFLYFFLAAGGAFFRRRVVRRYGE